MFRAQLLCTIIGMLLPSTYSSASYFPTFCQLLLRSRARLVNQNIRVKSEMTLSFKSLTLQLRIKQDAVSRFGTDIEYDHTHTPLLGLLALTSDSTSSRSMAACPPDPRLRPLIQPASSLMMFALFHYPSVPVPLSSAGPPLTWRRSFVSGPNNGHLANMMSGICISAMKRCKVIH